MPIPTMRCMYCRGCHYPLANLTENRCPECGVEFDPDDVQTYAVALTSAATHIFMVAAAVCYAGALLTLGSLLYAGFALSGFGELFDVLFFAVYWLTPYAILILIARIGLRRQSSIIAAIILLSGSLLILGHGIWLIVSVMTVHIDGQAGTVIAFLPTLQILTALVVAMSAGIYILRVNASVRSPK